MPIVGIDLGTTNSLISYWTDEGVVIIPNALGSNLTPSVVSVDDNGEVMVGQIAKERLITNPNSTMATFKRYMGTQKYFKLGKLKFLPEELSSFIIRALKQDAEAYLGESIQEAVISVPAYFNDAQRKATQRAGELAGLKVERIISEPTAAAVAYGFHEKESEAKLMVFDLGGGTFDVSILDLFENVMEVQAVAGNNFLGGEDFTDIIAAMFMHKSNFGIEDINKKVYGSIRKEAEICKRKLSTNKAVEMNCAVNEKNYSLNITREEFEDASKDLIDQLRKPIERSMRDACVEPDEIDSIILVGGATRMTLVSSFISKLFGRIPNSSINPDEAVVIGAGIQAGMKERNAALKEVVLTDVCPYTLGTGISIRNNVGDHEGGHFLPIIERNTVIPVSKVKRLYTIYNNQKSINVDIYQGESRLTKDNIKLGELNVGVPAAKAGEQAIDVRYTYDINGILEVEVTAVETGIKKRVVIEQNPGFMSKEEIEERLKALENIKIHPRDRQENKLLLARGERLYEELLGIDRMMVEAVLREFQNVLNEQDDKAAKKAAHICKMKLDEIEMYKEY